MPSSLSLCLCVVIFIMFINVFHFQREDLAIVHLCVVTGTLKKKTLKSWVLNLGSLSHFQLSSSKIKTRNIGRTTLTYLTTNRQRNFPFAVLEFQAGISMRIEVLRWQNWAVAPKLLSSFYCQFLELPAPEAATVQRWEKCAIKNWWAQLSKWLLKAPKQIKSIKLLSLKWCSNAKYKKKKKKERASYGTATWKKISLISYFALIIDFVYLHKMPHHNFNQFFFLKDGRDLLMYTVAAFGAKM